MRWEGDIVAENLFIDSKWVVIEEWLDELASYFVGQRGETYRIAREHFKSEDPKRPPVHSFAVSLAQYNLRSEVFRCSTQCKRSILYNLCEAEIGNMQVALSIEQQILWFQISVDDVA